MRAAGLAAPLTVERDALGIPTILGASRRDVAFGTGFVHAQDRFFQMDLLRRRAAGELAEVVGTRGFKPDAAMRVHRFRDLARRVVASSSPEAHEVLEAYARGVNAGLASLQGKPFEYFVFRAEPADWKPEDSILVLLAMFLQLQDENGAVELNNQLLRRCVPQGLVAFLDPDGTEWDAPLVGGARVAPPVPAASAFDLRDKRNRAATAALLGENEPAESEKPAGSNAWAVAGPQTADGGALLANELHLNLTVPNLWYRASYVWPGERVTGATLPGLPAMVVGTNGRVAWGFSNSVVDTSDLVVLEVDPRDPEVYRTPEGPRRIERHREVLRARGGGEKTVTVDWTVWGPIMGQDRHGRPLALRWVANEPGGVDFEILHLETVRGLDEALDVANRSGVPALNFVVADAAGRVAWTILGRLPRRVGFAGRLPGSWADGTRRWEGLLPPGEVPQVVDPPHGRVWTANNRIVDGDMLTKLGDGGYLLGARARQIRDGLMAVERATVDDMLRIQLDNRALFLGRWRDLLLSVLTPEAVSRDPRRGELREQVEDWGGRAAVDSAGYLMVRTFRVFLARDLFQPLTTACRTAEPDFEYMTRYEQMEGPLWRLVSERPGHLLEPRFTTWEERLLATADDVIAHYTEDGRTLRERTWGERNTTAIRHPLSRLLPGSGRWLDMPARQLPGDQDMPLVQHAAHGATLRMVVSPGREEQGIFHMPGGQSGNPLSPHYRDGYDAWAEGRKTSFLPGPTVHTLHLVPAR
jgi:penicillin amidase